MTGKQARFMVQVHPNARRNSLVSFSNNILNIKIAAPPVEGKANQELVKYLSKLLDIRKSDIEIDKGLTGRTKTVIVSGIDGEEFQSAIIKLINL